MNTILEYLKCELELVGIAALVIFIAAIGIVLSPFIVPLMLIAEALNE